MIIDTNDVQQLAVATYWLAQLFRRGESIPDGIGFDAAVSAARVARRLQLPEVVIPWPIVGRCKARIRVESATQVAGLEELLIATDDPTLFEVSRCDTTAK